MASSRLIQMMGRPFFSLQEINSDFLLALCKKELYHTKVGLREHKVLSRLDVVGVKIPV